MKVILLQNVKKLGKKGEIKEVSDGFAANYLLPKGLVEPASPENITKLEHLKLKDEELANQELEQMQQLAEALDGLEIEIPMKVNETNQLFASVTPKVIQKALEQQGYRITENQIGLPESIKEIGEFDVDLNLDHNLEAKIKVIVVPER